MSFNDTSLNAGSNVFNKNLIKVCSQFFPETCCQDLIYHSVLPEDCVGILTSKLLGYLIVFGAMTVLVPQLLKIHNSKSGTGISIKSVVLDLGGITLACSYNIVNQFPFSVWGDALFILIQLAILVFLVLRYEISPISSYLFLIVYLVVVGVFFSGMVPPNALYVLVAANVPVGVLSRGMQIQETNRIGHTGQTSLVTHAVMSFGTIVRLGTIIYETGDLISIVLTALNVILNAVCTCQFIYYWRATNRFLLRQKMKLN